MARKEAQAAVVQDGKRFWGGSSGRWAAEQLARAVRSGKPINASLLRTADTLRKDEWIEFDEELVAEGTLRLRGVADLIAGGLTRNIPNSLGKTVFQYEKVTDMEPAEVSMSGLAATEDDRQEFSLDGLPVPITHKDFTIDLRVLEASRNRGESLDTMQVRTAGRLIAEKLESMLFNGGPTFGGLPIYGYLNHPAINTDSFSAGTWSLPAVDGEDILVDILSMIETLEQDRYNSGPYRIYVPSGYSVKLEADFKANSDKTIRQRILEVDRVAGISVADTMPADTVVMVQMTRDVVTWLQGEPLQTVQWDALGGFRINFKGLTIQVPLIRSAPNHDTPAEPRSGIVKMT